MKTALLLDDERNLLQILTLYLERCGYAVLPSATCESAIRQFENRTGAIDLLIADVVMPTGSGVEVAAQLVREQPGLRILLMSGYPAEVWSEPDRDLLDRLDTDSIRILLKPFSPGALMQLLDELMGSARTMEARSVA